ncbi:MAG: acyltransferase family protein [Mariprofundaceae bacterium]
MKYRAEIDGLRALAIVPVILFHAGFEQFSGGFVGVDVFFVISGYLITAIILSEKELGTFSLLDFYDRRARRILPALFCVMLVSLPFAWFWLLPADMNDFSKSLIAVSTFSSNIYFWSEIGYWGAANELKPMLHTWSLAVEEQYYVLFPLYLMLMWRFRKRWILGSFLVIAAISLLVAQWGAYHKPSANFFLLPSRGWELAIGASIAFYFLYRKKTIRKLLSWKIVDEMLSLLGLLMITYAVFLFDEHVPHPSIYTLIPVIGTGLIILFSSKETLVGRFLGAKVLVGIGLISYSTYLWHQPLFSFARHRSLTEPSDGLFIILALSSCLLGYVSWRYVEKPFRERGRVSSKSFFIFAVTGLSIFIVIGLMGYFSKGFKDRIVQGGQKLSSIEQSLGGNYGLSKTCDLTFTLSSDCRTSDDPEIMVWGDSYAMHLVSGIMASNPDAKIIQMTKSSCGPFMSLAPVITKYPKGWARGCMDFNHQVIQWLQDNNTVKYAVLSSPFQAYLSKNSQVLLKNNKRASASLDLAVQSFKATLQWLKSQGVTPIVFSPPPITGDNLGRCLSRARLFGENLNSCDFRKAEIQSGQQAVYSFLDEIGRDYNVYFLQDDICAHGLCTPYLDNTFLYRDAGHLSSAGSAVLGKKKGFYRFITKGKK